jgi:hypothetical protein
MLSGFHFHEGSPIATGAFDKLQDFAVYVLECFQRTQI